jgi:uncharacterized protein YjaG (DUF416 family)
MPDRLAPLAAAGGVLFGRWIDPEVGGRVPAMKKMMHRLESIFQFNGQVKQEVEAKTFEAVAQLVVELVKIKENHMPKDHYSLEALIDLIASSLEDVIAHVRKAADAVNPMAYTVQELIENVFMGPDEVKLAGTALF